MPAGDCRIQTTRFQHVAGDHVEQPVAIEIDRGDVSDLRALAGCNRRTDRAVAEVSARRGLAAVRLDGGRRDGGAGAATSV